MTRERQALAMAELVVATIEREAPGQRKLRRSHLRCTAEQADEELARELGVLELVEDGTRRTPRRRSTQTRGSPRSACRGTRSLPKPSSVLDRRPRTCARCGARLSRRRAVCGRCRSPVPR